jgi:hypothetical protein
MGIGGARMNDYDSASVVTTQSGKKRDIVQRILEKATTYMQKEENKRWFQIFVLDPVLGHILDRIFPYIVIMCIILIVIIILIMLTFYIVFTKLSGAASAAALPIP